MARRHPCERGLRCSCHRAGPSTLPAKKSLLAAAALVCPVLAAPTATRSPTYLNPTLEKRVTDAGQAPDDPSEGFTHQHIQLADLIRAGLPYKYVYDPKASADHQIEVETNGAWVIDDSWSLHGRRFGPLSATATAGITDDPLPTPTESIPPASTPTPITTTSSTPTILAIQSSLPTGWDSTQYARSEMYAIPLVVSFSLVIALMIGSLIGAMVIRRDRSRSRRRKKRITEQGDDDDSTREKVMQSSLVSRVGRALKHRGDPPEEEVQSELEHRVKNWARRSSAWRAQARIGVRRRMGRGRKRPQADSTALSGAIQEEPEPEDEPRNTTRASSPVRSRAPTPILTVTENQTEPPSAAPNYSSPVVPTYSSPPPAAGPSTPSPIARLEAHPDATPSDEPAYDGPGSGQGLPPAYRGGGMSEIARGKRPAHVSSESVHQVPEERRDERRVWTELDAYAFGQGGNQVVTAHVATDDKRVLEQLHSMRGAPEEEGQGGEHDVQAPREEDVFGTGPSTSFPSSTPSEAVSSGAGALPLPPTKTGTGPVARYGEADLCLPGYLDGGSEGMGVSGKEGLVLSAPEDMEMVPSAPGDMDMGTGMVPSAPPCEDMALPSAPPALEDDEGPSVSLGPSAPPFPLDDTNDQAHPTPSAPNLDDTLPTPQTPHLRSASSTCPLLSEDR